MVALLLSLLFLGTIAQGHGKFGGWKEGRATHFGAASDGWSIHAGHCMYGYLDKNQCTGWNVAALSDQMGLYKEYQGSAACGICVEVRCKNKSFKDGNGEFLDRNGVCFDESKSLVLQVVDRCPCQYADNAASNKRWCCGDMDHMDMSVYAMAQLADVGKGVIGIQYRQVPCNYKPAQGTYNRFPKGEPALKGDAQDWGAKKARPCDGETIPQAEKMTGTAVYRPGASKDKKCQWSVSAGKQCGGKFRNKKPVFGAKDTPWPGYCCKKGHTCKRLNMGWWQCSK